MQKLADTLSIDLIDLESEINSVGNYLYLLSLEKKDMLTTAYTFGIVMVGVSLSGQKDSLYPIVESVISDTTDAMLNAELIDISKINLRIKERLFQYEVRITIEEELV